MPKIVRVAGWVALAGVVLAVVAVMAGRIYLSTDAAKQKIAGQLAGVVGGPVIVSSVETGVASTGVAVVLPSGSPEPTVPALLTGTVRVNASLLGLATGGMPSEITVDDASVVLRLDKDGNPLDPLPSPKGGAGGGAALPTIRLNNAKIRVLQEGRPDFAIGGVSATVTPNDGKLTIAGTIDDPAWNKWTVTGDSATEAGTGAVTLKLDQPAPLKQAMLKSIPMVPTEVWEEVSLDGTANGSVRLALTEKGFEYRVDMTTTGATITVPAIDLTLKDAAGGLVVDGSKVEIRAAHGRAADGDVFIDAATLDFGPTEPVLAFKIRAKGLDVKKLPAHWGLPKQFEGKLRGGADLTLKLTPNGVVPSGSGKGVLDDAKVAGFPADLVEVRLRGDGKRYRFDAGGEASSRLEPRRNGLATMAALAVLMLQAPAAPAQPADAKPVDPKEPTYVTANLKLRDVDLAELLARLEVKVPVKLSGKVTLAVSASIPVADPNSLKKYRVKGTVTVPALGVEALSLNDVAAEITFRDGVLSLASLTAKVPGGTPGTVLGTASYGVDPPADLVADLKLGGVPLGEVFKAVPPLAGTADGIVSGNLALKLPAEKLTDVTAAVAAGKLTSPGLTAVGRKLGATAITLALRDGTARITDAETVAEGLPVKGLAALKLTGKMPFSAAVQTRPDEPVSVRKLAPEAGLPFEVAGNLGIDAKATGFLSPLEYQVTGTAKTTDLVVGSAKLGALAFDWGLDPEALTVSNVVASLYDGAVNGSLRVPLSGGKPGEFKVEAKDLDATALTKDLPSLPVKLDGRFSGTVSGGLPTGDAAAKTPPIRVDLSAPKMRVQGIPTTRLKGTANYEPGKIGYELTGDALGGSFDLNGSYPLTTAPAAPESSTKPPAPAPDDIVPAGAANPPAGATAAPPGGRFRLTGARLSRVAEALGVPALAPLRGRVDVDVSYSFDATGRPSGSGRVRVIDFAWGDDLDGGDLSINLAISDTGIEFQEVSARIAGGDLRGRARYLFARSDRSFFNVTLDRAELGKLTGPLGLGTLGGAESRVTINVRGGLGREYRGTGSIFAARGKLAGVDVGDTRLPFEWAFVPGSGGEIEFRQVAAQVAGGRVDGQAIYRWGASSRLEGNLRFVDVSIRQLVASTGGVTPGRASGRFEFGGTDVKSVNDVTGVLTSTFGGEAYLFDLPVFRIIAPFLSVGRLTAPVTEGDLRARLANGRFNISRLALLGPNVQLFATGLVGLNGRLDLDVVARTSNLALDPAVLRLFRLQVPAFGPIPISLALQIGRYLSNRTVRLKVTGPASQPSVQVNVAAILAEEAIRFLLGLDSFTAAAAGAGTD